MKYAILIAAALLASPTAYAQGSTSTPGQQMQDGDGSSLVALAPQGYAPGRQMQDKGSAKGTTGASGYAPGHTKSNISAGDRDHQDKSKSKY